jgi:hypothetical protein
MNQPLPIDDTLVYQTHISEYHVVEKDLLYNEYSSFDPFHSKTSTVYMLVKTKRIKFIPESFKIKSDFIVEGMVNIGDRREAVAFNPAKFLFASSGVTHQYESWEDWAAEAMSHWRVDSQEKMTPSQIYRQFSGIDLEQSTEDLLYLNCKLVQTIKKGNLDTRNLLSPVQLAHMFDWDLLDPLEVMYIGKSKNDVLDRARNHNKWGEITTDLSPEEVALVYFMAVETTSVKKIQAGPLISYTKFEDKEIDRNTAAIIAEAALIKHFFDEKRYNKEIVEQDFETVNKVKEKLIKRGYTSVIAELKLDGVFGEVGTAKTGYHVEHTFVHSASNI